MWYILTRDLDKHKGVIVLPQKELAPLQYEHMWTLKFYRRVMWHACKTIFLLLVKNSTTRKDVPQHFYKLVLCVAESPWWTHSVLRQLRNWEGWRFEVWLRQNLCVSWSRSRQWFHQLICHLWETFIHKLRSGMLQENLMHDILVLKINIIFQTVYIMALWL